MSSAALDMELLENDIKDLIGQSAGQKGVDRLNRLRLALTHHLAQSHYIDLSEPTRLGLVQQIGGRLAILRAQSNPLTSTPATAPRRCRSFVPAPQLDPGLFPSADLLPKRPYCTDNFEFGTQIRGLAAALTRRYIEVNRPCFRVWSIFDIDRPDAAMSWEAAGLPPPSWTTVNKENGHAHLAWRLSIPVLINSPDMRLGPLRYLSGIESMMHHRLQADPGFCGLLTKNPMHPDWECLRGPQQGYSLSELAAHLPGIEKHFPRPRAVPEIGLGRNVALFDFLRNYAYQQIRYYKLDIRNFVAWQSHLNSRALVRNAEFLPQMDGREVWHIAKSVAKWTWRRFDLAASDAQFSKLQAARGQASGLARRAAREDARASARLMAVQGYSSRAIAPILGVNQSTVSRWLGGDARTIIR